MFGGMFEFRVCVVQCSCAVCMSYGASTVCVCIMFSPFILSDSDKGSLFVRKDFPERFYCKHPPDHQSYSFPSSSSLSSLTCRVLYLSTLTCCLLSQTAGLSSYFIALQLYIETPLLQFICLAKLLPHTLLLRATCKKESHGETVARNPPDTLRQSIAPFACQKKEGKKNTV